MILRRAEFRSVLFIAAFAAAFVLGVIGYQDVYPQLNLRTAVFQSIQLFVLEGGVVDGRTPWTLEIARFLAPALLGYAAIRGVMLLARDQVALWKTRIFTRGHVLILGNSAWAGTVTDQLVADGRAVVVITPQSGAFIGQRERGAVVLEGDPSDTLIVARGRPDRASDVVILMEQDVEALRALNACEAASGGATSARHVALHEPRLWEELHAIAFADAKANQSVEFFLVADREARVLLQGLSCGSFMVEAEGAVLERLVLTVARAALLDDREVALAFGPRAGRHRETLIQASPWLADAVRFVESDALDESQDWAAVIAGVEDAAAIAFGAALARRHPDAAVRVAVSDLSVRQALASSRLTEPNLELVPAATQALGRALLADSATEILARAKHEDYTAREAKRGETAATNPSLVGWHELPPSLQQSNRRFAQSVAGKLDMIGASLTPLSSAVVSGDLALPPSLLDDLARDEHDRWMNDLIRDGWQPTTGTKDPDRKLHPLLVPWDDLNEVEREKDRDGFRAMPRLVARAGYQLTITR